MNKEKMYSELKQFVSNENILLDEPMKKHTSFKIGGPADFFVIVENIEQIRKIISFTKDNNVPLIIIGNGSNMLVRDSGIRGLVLKINLNSIKIKENKTNEKSAIVTVGSGVILAVLAQKLLNASITGFEFAAGIPGTIGGAIKMNAGAHGKEFKDIVIETTYMDMDGKIYTINNEQHDFLYRSSRFKNNDFIILETKLKLEYIDDNKKIKDKMNELLNERKLKQPLGNLSAGSTFKRGNDFITAKLIDECGLKGYSIGDAQVSEKHAGFIINKGNATAEDVLKLVQYIKTKIKEKFNKDIFLEIEVVGE